MLVLIGSLTGMLVAIPVVLLYALCYAPALCVLWGWFVVPVFALPALTFWQAAGLVLLVRFLCIEDADCRKPARSHMEDWCYLLGAFVGKPLVTLGVGSLMTLFL